MLDREGMTSPRRIAWHRTGRPHPRLGVALTLLLAGWGFARLVAIGDGSPTPLSFRARTVILVDPGVEAVAVGDFNGDTVPDVVFTTAERSTRWGSVQIMLGRGLGVYDPPQLIDRAQWRADVLALDLNHDQRLDLAVADRFDDRISVFLGRGDGTFQPPTTSASLWGPYDLADGDFNRDGHLDLIATNRGADVGLGTTVAVFLGRGDGSFEAARYTTVGRGPNAVTVGDFNQDGWLDAATANLNAGGFTNPGTISILLGRGDGTFDSRSQLVGRGPRGIASGDLNDDGRLDLAVTNSWDHRLSILIGQGDGTFEAWPDLSVDATPSFITLADLNADERLDLVFIQNSGTLSIWWGQGQGVFEAGHDYGAHHTTQRLTLAEATGDEALDVVLPGTGGLAGKGIDGPGAVSILAGVGDGTFHAGRDFTIGSEPYPVLSVDVNGDGLLDVAATTFGSPSSLVSILLGRGDGTFDPARHRPVAPNIDRDLATADFNRDGTADLIVASGWPGREGHFSAGTWRWDVCDPPGDFFGRWTPEPGRWGCQW